MCLVLISWIVHYILYKGPKSNDDDDDWLYNSFFFLSFSWYGISFTKKGFYFVWFEAKCVLVSVYLCVCVCVQPKHDLCISTLTLTLNYFVSFFWTVSIFFLLNRSFDWLFGWWSVSSGGEFSHFFSSHSWTKKKSFLRFCLAS